MAKQEQKKPQEQREAHPEREAEPRPSTSQESHEGLPGYGQPPEQVRERKLPDQKW
jgi:hypothetical protein